MSTNLFFYFFGQFCKECCSESRASLRGVSEFVLLLSTFVVCFWWISMFKIHKSFCWAFVSYVTVGAGKPCFSYGHVWNYIYLYNMKLFDISGIKSALVQSVCLKLTIDLHLASRLTMHGAVPPPHCLCLILNWGIHIDSKEVTCDYSALFELHV